MSVQSIAQDMGRGVDVDKENQELRAVQKIRQSGGSTVVTIPAQMMRLLDLELDDEIEIQAEILDDEIRIRAYQEDEDEAGGEESEAAEPDPDADEDDEDSS